MPTPQFLALSGPKGPPPHDGTRSGPQTRNGVRPGESRPGAETDTGARADRARSEGRDWKAALEGGARPGDRARREPVRDPDAKGHAEDPTVLFALPGENGMTDLPGWLREALAAQDGTGRAAGNDPLAQGIPGDGEEASAQTNAAPVAMSRGIGTGLQEVDAKGALPPHAEPGTGVAAQTGALDAGGGVLPGSGTVADGMAGGKTDPARQGGIPGETGNTLASGKGFLDRGTGLDGTAPEASAPGRESAEMATMSRPADIGPTGTSVGPAPAFVPLTEMPMSQRLAFTRNAAGQAPASVLADGSVIRTGVETATAVPATLPLASDAGAMAGFPSPATFDPEGAMVKAEFSVRPDFAEILAQGSERSSGLDAAAATGRAGPVTLADLKLSLAERIASMAPTGGDGDPKVQSSGPRTAEVELAPGDLGRLRILLQTGDRGLHLVVAVERPEMVEAVRRHLDGLHRALIAEGVTLDSVDIGSDRKGSGGAEQNVDAQPAGRTDRGPDTDAPDAPDAPDRQTRAARPPLRDGRLDISL